MGVVSFLGLKVKMSELSAALKDVLEKRGVLSEVRAKLRSEVYKSLDDQRSPKPKLCQENLLLNELIRDYLLYNQYKYTHSVLLAESGQPQEPLDRAFLSRELNLREDGDSMPLLYRMLASFKGTAAPSSSPDSHQPHPQTAPTAPVSEGEGASKATCTFEEPTYYNTS